MKLAELYNKGMQQKTSPQEPEQPNKPNKSNVNIIVKFPEVSALIKHLDMLYSHMIVNNMNNASNNSMWEKVGWFNPGQGAVKQSQSVN